MRWLALIAVSTAVHGAILASLPAPSRALARPLPAPVVELEPAPPPFSDAVAIEFVTLPTLPDTSVGATLPEQVGAAHRPAAHDSATYRSAAHDGATYRSDASGGESRPQAESVDGATYGTGALSMRDRPKSGDAEVKVEKAVIWHRHPHADLVDAMIAMGPAAPLPEDPATGELEAQRDGSYVKRDSVFTATVNPDGTVSFDDRPNLNVKLHVPSPKKVARAVKKRMAEWAEDPYGTADGAGFDEIEGPNPYDDDGDGKNDEGDTFTIVSGRFDGTDAVMRALGQDPYAAKKLAFLDRTRDERVDIGKRHRKQQYEESEKTILGHLRKLWRRDDLDAAEKRELVFELWDDCAETGDDDLIDAGIRARAALLRFVDVHLPVGSKDAFGDDELRRLNAGRQSTVRFAPYN